jgi:hypothetical protein
VYEVEFAGTDDAAKIKARLGIGEPPLTTAECEYLDVYIEPSQVIDLIAHEAARRRFRWRRVDVREAEHIHR